MPPDTLAPMTPTEAVMAGTILRRSGAPALAYWDGDRRRWRLAVCWPGEPVRRYDDFPSAAAARPGWVSPYDGEDGA